MLFLVGLAAATVVMILGTYRMFVAIPTLLVDTYDSFIGSMQGCGCLKSKSCMILKWIFMVSVGLVLLPLFIACLAAIGFLIGLCELIRVRQH